MKKIVLLIIILNLVSYSCNSDDDTNPRVYEDLWVLVKMSGTQPNSETTGDAMEWQEFYDFSDDTTFIKSRTRNNTTIEIFGVYKDSVVQGEAVLFLSYPEDNEIIGSCSGTPEEQLYFTSATTMISNWQACDGPALFYEKR
ncbi:hypothetical protein ACJRPK_16380 [Aquimarina sp. 2-A2]|uniref:hypothetical protein n=1 Tax=Aquimarina sp. 2-A2 TaxID=3382644 RepID=UPI00387F1DE4